MGEEQGGILHLAGVQGGESLTQQTPQLRGDAIVKPGKHQLVRRLGM